MLIKSPSIDHEFHDSTQIPYRGENTCYSWSYKNHNLVFEYMGTSMEQNSLSRYLK